MNVQVDKYEYTIKSDKIKKLVERKDYETAVKIADTIDWNRVKNIKMLSTVSLAYEKLERYDEAKDILLMAYECAPVGRRFLYKLTELAVKQGRFEEAEDYMKEFAATSPQDPGRLILRYEVDKAKGEPKERLITILEAYQKREFEEKWSYELAALYYAVGKTEECVKLCDEIVLWFGVGTYVDKAMDLKQRIAPLTPDQIEKKENKEKYLRRLEDVQKEFEERYRVLEANVQKVQNEQSAAGQKEAQPEVKEGPTEANENESLTETTMQELSETADLEKTIPEQEISGRENQPEEKDGVSEEALAQAALQAEMEANLAREIEHVSLVAAVDAVVLRETAATMETVGAVENDHSQEKERTKVAEGNFSTAPTKTKEFVRQAKAINAAIEESFSRPVTVEAVEEKLAQMDEKSKEEPVVSVPTDEEALPEVPAAEEPLLEETVTETVIAEEAIAEEPVMEEPVAEASVAEEAIIEEVAAEEPVVAESVTEEAMAVSLAEAVVLQPQGVEEVSESVSSLNEEPIVEITEEIIEEVQEISETQKAVRDHYVLAAYEDSDAGLKECVTYIKKMRELLGVPASQMAKITGSKLATKDMEKTLRKLQGRDLIVVGIADLPDTQLEYAIDRMAKDGAESFIALLDTEEEILKLQCRMAFFADCRVLSPEPEEVDSEPVAEVQEEPKVSAETEVTVEESVPVVQEEAPVALPAAETSAETMKQEKDRAEEEEALRRSLAQLVEEALRMENPQEEKREESSCPERNMEEASVNFAETQDVPAQETPAAAGEMTAKAFFEFASQYAHMLDAVIDDMGTLAVFAKAEEYQQDREPLTEELAQEMVEKAILKAERRTFKSIFSNRYDKEGYLILKEEHFKEH